jgi:tetratricopeptide (TPR) repeat protein
MLALALTIHAWDAPSKYSWLAAGVAIGLAATARPDILAFAVVLACAIGWLIFKRKLPMQAAINVAGLAIGVGVMLAVVGLTSLALSGHFTVLPGGSPINFYVGNNPDYRSTIGIRPASWSRIVDLSVLEENTGSAESGTFYYRKALSFIKGQPVAYLGDLLFKVRTLVGGYELPDVLDLYTSSRHNPIMSLLVWRTAWFAFPYGLLLPLALLGIFITRHDLARSWLLLALMGSMLASLIGYWNVSRYRMSIVPILIMFAAESLVWLWSRRKSFTLRSALVPACVAAGVMIITNFPYDHFSKSYNYQAEAYTLAGDTLAMKGQPQRAIELLSQGVALDPNNSYNHWRLGSVFLKTRQAELAAPEFQAAVNIDPSSYRAQYELGVALSIGGNHEGALEAFSNAINANQTFYPAYADLAREYARGGQLKQASTYFSKALELNPGDAYLYNDVGVLLIKQNKTKEAIDFFSQAVDLAPNFEMAKRNLEMAKQGAPK